MNYVGALLVVSAFWGGFEIVVNLIKRADRSRATPKDRLSMLVLWILFAVGSCVGVMLTSISAARLPSVIRVYSYWGGLALIVIGVAIRCVAIATLKQYFTVDVAIANDHKVIDHGVYGIVRHPSYAGSLLSFIGLGLAFVNWLSLAVVVVCTTAGLAYRIAVEEEALTAALGDEYRAYAARTKRLIPGMF